MKPQTTKRYIIENGQLNPKEEKRWQELIKIYDSCYKSIAIPVEKGYYCYIMGIEQRNMEWESLNSARMKFINKYIESGLTGHSIEEHPEYLRKVYLKNAIIDWNTWLVESVMSGVFDEIILREGKE